MKVWVVSRWGGDEFEDIVAAYSDEKIAEQVAEVLNEEAPPLVDYSIHDIELDGMPEDNISEEARKKIHDILMSRGHVP